MGTPDLNCELPFRAMIAIYDEPRTNATVAADMWSATPKQLWNEAYWEGKFNIWSQENYNSIIWLGPNELGAFAAGGGQVLLTLDEFPEAKELSAAESAKIIAQMRTLFGRAKKKGQNNYLYTHSVWVTPAFAKGHGIDGRLPESGTVSRFHNTQYGPKHYPECGVVNKDTKRYTAGVFAEFASLYKDLDGFYVNIGEALPGDKAAFYRDAIAPGLRRSPGKPLAIALQWQTKLDSFVKNVAPADVYDNTWFSFHAWNSEQICDPHPFPELLQWARATGLPCVATVYPANVMNFPFNSPRLAHEITQEMRKIEKFKGFVYWEMTPPQLSPLFRQALGYYGKHAGPYSDEHWVGPLTETFGDRIAAGHFLNAYNRSGRIIPETCALVYAVSDWVKRELRIPYALTRTTCAEETAPQRNPRIMPIGPFGRGEAVKSGDVSPLDHMKMIKGLGDDALKEAEAGMKTVPPKNKAAAEQAYHWMRGYRLLACYYESKVAASVYAWRFRSSQRPLDRQTAERAADEALSTFRDAAAYWKEHLNPLMIAAAGRPLQEQVPYKPQSIDDLIRLEQVDREQISQIFDWPAVAAAGAPAAAVPPSVSPLKDYNVVPEGRGSTPAAGEDKTKSKPRKPSRNPAIKYVNPDLPEFNELEFKGTRYRDIVPDTLDLAERAALAVHGLTATTDPDNNAELYFSAIFSSKPPFMYHDLNDWCEYKYYAPSALLRQASGSTEGLDVEWHRMANLLQMQGPDGLFYVPQVGRPWAQDDAFQGDLYKSKGKEQVTVIWMHGRLLEAAGVYYRLSGDERWKRLGDKAVSALAHLAVDCGDHAYFLKTVYAPEETTQSQKGAVPPPSLNHGAAWAAQGLTTYYRMTQSKPALELARKLARFYMLGHSGFVGPNGEFHGSHEDTAFKDYSPQARTHFHMNSLIRMAMLDAGIESGDRALVEMAQRGYAFGKARGNALSGFFPEYLNVPPGYGNTCELCCTADMIYLALRQSTSGTADCWNDVDRWVRNMFAEAQLTDVGWVQAYSARFGEVGGHPHRVSENVPERTKGVWGGWVALNEWQTEQRSIMACCVGNSAMQLFRVWRDMLTFEPKKSRLAAHLLLNRASPWGDVYSHIPNKGLVEVKLKRDGEVALRIPEWTKPQECKFRSGGKDATPAWEGRYAVVTGKKGETVSLSCPIAERTEKVTTPGGEYQVVVRGNTIVDINPAGANHPLFKRAQYRQPEARMKQVMRFVADKTVDY